MQVPPGEVVWEALLLLHEGYFLGELPAAASVSKRKKINSGAVCYLSIF